MPQIELIIDDSLTNNLLFKSLLQLKGIDSKIAFNGKETFSILQKEKPAPIIKPFDLKKVM